MREIIFRGWDKKNKSMGHVYSMVVDERRDFAHFSNIMMRTVYDKAHWFYRGDVILMQYIGFKDKNNKRIYEKDIVKHAWFKNGEPFVIENLPFLFYDFIEYGVFEEEDGDFHYFEIIGNVYENPELLEEK